MIIAIRTVTSTYPEKNEQERDVAILFYTSFEFADLQKVFIESSYPSL